MKKRLTLSVCALVMMACLMACGQSETDKTYGGHTAAEYEQVVTNELLNLESLTSQEQIDYNISYFQQQAGSEVTVAELEDFKEVFDEKGAYVGVSDFEVTKSGKTITATLTADYTGRDLKLIFVYNALHVDEGPTAKNVELVYSLGETMQKAGLNTIMGIGIVFVMLVVMSIIISAFNLIPAFEKKLKNKGKEETAVVAETKAEVVAEANDDLELIAVIAAAIAASTGTSTDSFVVRSIKRRH